MFYKINLPQIVHETIEGETFIINTASGIYYVVNGYASIIWNAIANEYSFEQIQRAVESGSLFDNPEKVLENFFSVLLAEELIVFVENNGIGNTSQLYIEKNTAFQLPILSKHDDLQEMITLDPIHDVSESQGWPFQKETA